MPTMQHGDAQQQPFGMAMSEAEVEVVVREVTDEEVAHYHEYGWVMMRGLVDPRFAEEMLRALRASDVDCDGHPARFGVEPFRSFMFSRRMSSNAAKLVNRARLKGVDVPMRWRQDTTPPTGITKPAGQTPSEEMPSELQHHDKNGVLLGSGFHCDSAEHGSDRAGELQFWLALAEVTPAMGPMRFINRSHREILGSVFNQDADDLTGQSGFRASGNILDQYPLLPHHPDFGVSEPEETHYQLGDCTVHHGYCAHGSINNATDRDRCSYLFSYSPADTRYWEAAGGANQGQLRLRAEDDDACPVIFRPQPLGGDAPLPVTRPPIKLVASSSSTHRALSEAEIEAVVREVTDDEVAHYHEYGWVNLRGLVAPSLVMEMLSVFRELGAEQEQEQGQRQEYARGLKPAFDGVEPFRSFMFSRRCGSNAAKLCNKAPIKGVHVPLRYRAEIAPVIKPKHQQPSTEPHGLGSGWHQDACEHGTDRGGELQFWLALAEVTPEMGPMRFINRSHREGPLGSVFNGDGDTLAGGVAGYRATDNLLEQYPLLPEVLGVSEPEETHYQLGDCTVHHGYCAHGSINNATDRDRCSYLFSYSPADSRYWGSHGSRGNPGSERLRAEDESSFPVMFRPTPLSLTAESQEDQLAKL
jgi:ectoine hydroxylase-related dioxygenase (phytanoyl-CoA dioxygenase family)